MEANPLPHDDEIDFEIIPVEVETMSLQVYARAFLYLFLFSGPVTMPFLYMCVAFNNYIIAMLIDVSNLIM